ncbi:MAG: fadD2 [Ramlibacter sp.]|nr:fadD2 [Ramlibacter sp.]
MNDLRPWEAALAKYGERAAFTFILPQGAHTSLSYRQVDALSSAFASWLIGGFGLSEGDVVAIQLPNCLHYPVAVLGAWKAGMIVTNVNPLYTEHEVRHQLVDSGAKALVACDLFLPRVEAMIPELGVQLMVVSLWDFFNAPVAAAIRAKMQPGLPAAPPGSRPRLAFMAALEAGGALAAAGPASNQTAVYQYTGGTTGRSKGAVISHRNVASVMEMTADCLNAHGGGFKAEDTVLTVLPLYHIFAFVVNFLMFLDVGARNVLIPNPRPIDNLRSAFEEFQIDWMPGVDTMFAGLLAQPWFRQSPPKMKFAVSGGTALRPGTAKDWQELVCPIIEGYGMTETTGIISCSPPVSKPWNGTVGLPIPGTQVRIIDAGGRELGTSQPGELLVRGPQVIEAYLNQPEETKSAIVDGWLHTGDIAQLEADGSIRIVDRKKDMIIVSGFNVYPNEVEAAIAAHPGVAEVAVIGVRDEATGEAVKAFVVAKAAGLEAQEVIAHCRTLLTGYKVPKQVEFMEQLPKSPVGKILRAKLRT